MDVETNVTGQDIEHGNPEEKKECSKRGTRRRILRLGTTQARRSDCQTLGGRRSGSGSFHLRGEAIELATVTGTVTNYSDFVERNILVFGVNNRDQEAARA